MTTLRRYTRCHFHLDTFRSGTAYLFAASIILLAELDQLCIIAECWKSAAGSEGNAQRKKRTSDLSSQHDEMLYDVKARLYDEQVSHPG